MYKYIDYFIKCIIRNITRLLFKPRILLTLIVILLLLFCFFRMESYAVYEGDDTYTDKNNTIILAYDSICNDFLTRLFQNSGTDLGEEIKNRLKNSQYSYYIYYGELDGSTLINASTFDTRTMHIYFWRNDDPNISATIYNNWQGIETNIYQVSRTGYTYTFTANDVIEQFDITPCYIPSILIGYENSNITSYITNSSSEQTESITNAITSSAATVTNTITNSTVEESSMSVNTEGMSPEDTQGIDNFFTNFLSMLQGVFTNIDDTVSTIEISVPYSNNSFTLRSDMISKNIKGTVIYTLIQAFWWFVIGSYLVVFCKRIFDWLSTGEIAERGVWAFIAYLDKNNELLKSYMM